MGSSTGEINNNGRNGNTCSPSKSSSTCSCPFSASSPVLPTPPARKLMEEVWKDISLASLQDHSSNTLSSTTTTQNPAFCATILQDFLARPLNKEPPTRGASSSGATELSLAVETTFLGSLAPTPATILSLNSGSDFPYPEIRTPVGVGSNPQLQRHAGFTASSFVSSFNSPFEFSCSSSAFPSCCKKRAQENVEDSIDRRHKRMIKNRESAARSRSRKQAYTNELELEVARLQKENARLRRQQEELCLVAGRAQLPKKHRIYRTSTAPF
ncbi:hypothetical protein F2P56_025284 [Juglans regia]|uniref:Protein FD-like isoform X1 n=2 Tax=Juglans regia TaxID=51240 RepID=A0A2I4HKR4_JUGRE|nr:protein FD-like isoform X1 [Juglans regia]KAF5455737.1 hypothetical protein F2P56_025284 [Juglans regia]